MKFFIIALLCLFIIPHYAQAEDRKDTLYQVSTINALLEGIYDSNITFEELKKHGDFGIGTLNGIDGELAGVDGHFYQIKTDGKVYKVPDSAKTPFAVVTTFHPDLEFAIDKPMNFPELKAFLDTKIPTTNIFYAIKIHGTFKMMKTRSVPKQVKPYPPMVEIINEQVVFDFEDVTGTIVGFRCPSYVQGLNVPEYHLHFLTEDKKAGGHILGLQLDKGDGEIDYLTKFFMILPDTKAFYRVNLKEDKAEDLHKVETDK